jgi:uncharacterized protein (DUF58 family)
MTVMLLVDVSASGEFGTQKQLKHELITELCAVLAFSSIQNNDKIGIIFFTDKIEKFIPPKKGKGHVLRIIRDLIEFKPEHKKTNIELALKYLTGVIKKRSIAFVISDFMDNNFIDSLKIANKKHDLVALRIYDKREQELPNIGLVKLLDAETGAMRWVDTSDKNVRTHFAATAKRRENYLKDTFNKCGVDTANINTAESYVQPLTNLFKRR